MRRQPVHRRESLQALAEHCNGRRERLSVHVAVGDAARLALHSGGAEDEPVGAELQRVARERVQHVNERASHAKDELVNLLHHKANRRP